MDTEKRSLAQPLRCDMSRLTASPLFDHSLMKVERDPAKEADVLSLLSAWLETNAITVHPSAREDCASAVVCWFDLRGEVTVQRLHDLAVLLVGWFMLDAICGEDDQHARELGRDYWSYGHDATDPMKKAIHLCNGHYASRTEPATRDHLAHYLKEWAYGSIFENSWRQASAIPQDILVRSRDMMVGFLPAVTATLIPAEVRAWQRYSFTEPALERLLTLTCRHITLVNDIIGMKQLTPGEPNSAAGYARVPEGIQSLVRYGRLIVEEMKLHYQYLADLEDSSLTSLCEKALRFCSGNAVWSLTCHRYNDAVADHDRMVSCVRAGTQQALDADRAAT